jgi:hypothetical protein
VPIQINKFVVALFAGALPYGWFKCPSVITLLVAMLIKRGGNTVEGNDD